VKNATKHRVVKWRRPVFVRPSLLLFKRPAKPLARAKNRKFYIGLGKRRALLLNFRRFHTNPSSRSKRYRQFILPLRGFGYKELSVRLSRLSAAQFSELGLALQPARVGSMLVMALGLMGLLYFGGILANPADLSPSPAYAAPVDPSPTELKPIGLERSLPLRLKAKAVGIDYPIKPIGLNEDGTIETPGLFESVTGWFEPGPSPGEVGPAVIVGHVNTYLGPSVFARLHELVPGDRISVSRQDGTTAVFKVQSIKQFSQDDFPTKRVYGPLDYAGLRLITCGGSFNAFSGNYSHNTIVFARLVD
jgi:hypothetical protein